MHRLRPPWMSQPRLTVSCNQQSTTLRQHHQPLPAVPLQLVARTPTSLLVVRDLTSRKVVSSSMGLYFSPYGVSRWLRPWKTEICFLKLHLVDLNVHVLHQWHIVQHNMPSMAQNTNQLLKGYSTSSLSSSVRKHTDREAEDGNIFFQPTATQRIAYPQETTTCLGVITIWDFIVYYI